MSNSLLHFIFSSRGIVSLSSFTTGKQAPLATYKITTFPTFISAVGNCVDYQGVCLSFLICFFNFCMLLSITWNGEYFQ